MATGLSFLETYEPEMGGHGDHAKRSVRIIATSMETALGLSFRIKKLTMAAGLGSAKTAAVFFKAAGFRDVPAHQRVLAWVENRDVWQATASRMASDDFGVGIFRVMP